MGAGEFRVDVVRHGASALEDALPAERVDPNAIVPIPLDQGADRLDGEGFCRGHRPNPLYLQELVNFQSNIWWSRQWQKRRPMRVVSGPSANRLRIGVITNAIADRYLDRPSLVVWRTDIRRLGDRERPPKNWAVNLVPLCKQSCSFAHVTYSTSVSALRAIFTATGPLFKALHSRVICSSAARSLTISLPLASISFIASGMASIVCSVICLM